MCFLVIYSLSVNISRDLSLVFQGTNETEPNFEKILFPIKRGKTRFRGDFLGIWHFSQQLFMKTS